MKKVHGTIACLVVAMIAGTASAQATDPAAHPDSVDDPAALARLDGFALGLTAADQFSGVVLVARNSRVLLEKAYGKSDAESDTLATTQTRYNLASVGKMFTSVAILQQIGAGRLTLDTRVGEVLEHYPNRAFADEVTIRQLLTHTAGAGDIDDLFGVENAAKRAKIHDVADIVALYGDRPPKFTPGSQQEYSNYGFIVLGRIVEVLSGEPYEAYVAKHVFGPAGMTHTGFVDCTDRAPDIAMGYATVDGKRVVNCATQPNRGLPAGGELSTVEDMFRFTEALKAGKLVPAALFADATRTHREFMGLGFFATGYGPDVPVRDFRWGHGGSTDGACTEVRVYPETGETIIALTNRDAPACFPVTNFLHEQWSLRHQVATQ